MPRKPRFFLPGVPVHIVHRGRSNSPIFFDDADYSCYLHCLNKSSQKYRVAIHAYVLMSNHVHLLVTPKKADDVSLFMQFLGRHYVPYVNRKYDSDGSIWEGRYKASILEEERYFLSIMRYIELNPVRASVVTSPSLYRWSSYCHNAGLQTSGLIEDHPIYLALANDKNARIRIYQQLFKSALDNETTENISNAWITGTPLGSDKFKASIEVKLMRKVGHDKRGRPNKQRLEKCI